MWWYWLLYILIGVLAGWIGGMIVKGSGSGFWVNLLLGIVGALLGGWIFRFFGLPAGSWFWGLLAAVVGAVILLLIWGAIARSGGKKA
jgi:uncharacterized membrane protein YeaQ/YmgE (transglycosylase-associated protein family)